MNLLIAFVILLCLCVSELRDPELAQHLGPRLTLLVAVALFVPSVAIFQTVIVGRRCKNQSISESSRQQILTRLSVSHSAVWLAASMAIVWGVRWPDIVRVNWGFEQWPLVDDLLILAPVLLSLFFSWAIFYDVKRLLNEGEAARSPNHGPILNWLHLKERLQFVGIRFRVYVLMSLIPILATLLVRDAANDVERLPVVWQNAAIISGGFAVLAFFPLLMLLAWKHQPIGDSELRGQLMDCCKRLKLGVWTIRAWNTSNQIINAVVAGVVPGLRVIVISDGMLDKFPQRELLAVVRHEAGHIRMCHVPIRMFFMLFPLILAAIDQINGAVIANYFTMQFESHNLTQTHAIAVGASVYIGYLLPTISWLSKQMEFEADWFSVLSEPVDSQKHLADDLSEHDSMTLAIARLAALSPDQFDRRTLMHPSLRQRMQRTARLAEKHVSASQLSSVTSRRQWLVRCTFALILFAFLLRSLIG